MNRVLKLVSWSAVFLGLFFLAAGITVWWGTSGKTVTVPDLRGKNVVHALKEVGRLGLDLRVIREEHDPMAPRDEIIEQYPRHGAKLKVDRNIQVVLSLGVRDIAIPDLRGLTLRKAELILKQDGLAAGQTTRIYAQGTDEETVLGQNPMPSATEVQENVVNLLVSQGPRLQEYRMPDLVGKDFDQSASLLESAGLGIGSMRHEEYPGAKENQITNQSPHFGYPVTRDTPIALVVNKPKTSPHGATVTRMPFSYRVPFRIPFPVAVDIYLDDWQGKRRIYTGRKLPKSLVELTLEISGEAVLEVYLNGKMAHSREYR